MGIALSRLVTQVISTCCSYWIYEIATPCGILIECTGLTGSECDNEIWHPLTSSHQGVSCSQGSTMFGTSALVQVELVDWKFRKNDVFVTFELHHLEMFGVVFPFHCFLNTSEKSNSSEALGMISPRQKQNCRSRWSETRWFPLFTKRCGTWPIWSAKCVDPTLDDLSILRGEAN